MNKENKKTLDSVLGVLAGVAAAEFANFLLYPVKKKGGAIVRTGCSVLSLCVALDVCDHAKKTFGKFDLKKGLGIVSPSKAMYDAYMDNIKEECDD